MLAIVYPPIVYRQYPAFATSRSLVDLPNGSARPVLTAKTDASLLQAASGSLHAHVRAFLDRAQKAS
jgi:hypothetical protein